VSTAALEPSAVASSWMIRAGPGGARAWNVPAVYRVVGGTDRETFERAREAGSVNALPSNHEPNFTPVIHPTLRAGIEAMLAAAGVWLVEDGGGTP
jgi:hippurate hydrolase